MRAVCPIVSPSPTSGSSYRYDAAIAATVFVVVLVCGSFAAGADGVSLAGVAACVALSVPLLWRRRYPYTVLMITAVALVPALEALDGTPPAAIAPNIALYTVASTKPTRMALFATLKLIVVVVLATALFSSHGVLGVETLKNVAMVIIPAAIGASVRDRRIAMEALRERAERAEATREEEALRRVGEERLRIAREVHDVVAHALVAINVQAGVAAHIAERRPGAAPAALGEIKRVSGEALADLRATLGVLREPDQGPPPTRPAPGIAAIEDLADRVRAAGVEVAIDVRPGERAVPSAVAAAGYRIVQEALTNVLRHARDARRVDVRVQAAGDALRIDVLDDGTGAGAAAPGSGNGLRGMRERAAAVGGELVAGRREEGGWRVLARLPIPVGRATA